MAETNFDARTRELECKLDQMLWDLSILDYRANELKRTCESIANGSSEEVYADTGETDYPPPGVVTHRLARHG